MVTATRPEKINKLRFATEQVSPCWRACSLTYLVLLLANRGGIFASFTHFRR